MTISQAKSLNTGDKTKMFIPFPDSRESDCRGENVWVEVVELRDTERGIWMRCKLLNTPISKEYHDIDYGDEVIAERGIANYERLIYIGKAPKKIIN